MRRAWNGDGIRRRERGATAQRSGVVRRAPMCRVTRAVVVSRLVPRNNVLPGDEEGRVVAILAMSMRMPVVTRRSAIPNERGAAARDRRMFDPMQEPCHLRNNERRGNERRQCKPKAGD